MPSLLSLRFFLLLSGWRSLGAIHISSFIRYVCRRWLALHIRTFSVIFLLLLLVKRQTEGRKDLEAKRRRRWPSISDMNGRRKHVKRLSQERERESQNSLAALVPLLALARVNSQFTPPLVALLLVVESHWSLLVLCRHRILQGQHPNEQKKRKKEKKSWQKKKTVLFYMIIVMLKNFFNTRLYLV